MENMTIKQVADALGVSKTFVRKYMDDDFRSKYTETTANGVITITPEGCKLLAETIGNRQEQPETSGNEFPKTTANSESITIPKVVWDALQDQLKAKDQQISDITKLLDQAQQLQAGTLQRALPGGPAEDTSEPVEAFQDDGVLNPIEDTSDAQEDVWEAVKGLSFGERVKLLFGRKGK